MNGSMLLRGHPTVGAQLGSISGGAVGPNPVPNRFQLATDYWIDPVNGNDKQLGLTAGTPFKTMARWRQLVWGARYGSPGFPTIVTIHALNGSTNLDDGIIMGVTTIGSAAKVLIQLTPTVIGGGTLTAGTVDYAGNNRALVFDTALPVSWTASYGISSQINGSRYIRKVGGGKQALIINDQGAKSAMIGMSTATSPTATGIPSSTLAPFVVGDVYEVVRTQSWPQLTTYACRGQIMNANIVGNTFLNPLAYLNRYVFCYFFANFATDRGSTTFYNCGFKDGASVFGESNQIFVACTIVDCPNFQFSDCSPNWNGQNNVFLRSTLSLVHTGTLNGSGTLRFFDCVNLFSLSRGSRADLSGGAIVGSNNTGNLVAVTSGSYITSTANVTATTSLANPYSVNGVAFAAPFNDTVSGCGMFA